MRVGVDYTAAIRQRGGIGRYTRNLIRALADLDSENSYTLFVAGGWGEGDGLGPWPPNFRIRAVPISDRWLHILWQRLRVPVPIQVVTGQLDLFHSPDFVLPPVGCVPAVLTVHDLSFMRVPDCFVPKFRRYLERAVARSVVRAVRILADSESTSRDLVELLGVSPERIVVIYPGVEPRFRPVEDVALRERVRSRYGLPSRFILGLGTLQPRKNFAGLVEAFRYLVHATVAGEDFADLQLVVVGSKGWMYEDTFAAVEKAGLHGRVCFVGFVDDDDLPVVYSLASAFVFPSLYEGFGLPVLEAMACGTPVVVANNSSLPEVVGKGGLLVPTGDAAVLAEALHRLLKDPSLRIHLAITGREQARRFSWGGAAQQLQFVYRSFGKAPWDPALQQAHGSEKSKDEERFL